MRLILNHTMTLALFHLAEVPSILWDVDGEHEYEDGVLYCQHHMTGAAYQHESQHVPPLPLVISLYSHWHSWSTVGRLELGAGHAGVPRYIR